MKRKPFILCTVVTLMLGAFSAPAQSIIASMPYKATLTGEESDPLLNPGWIIRNLDPLPAVRIPQSFPVEFTLSFDNLLKLRTIREAQTLMSDKKVAEAAELFRQVKGEDTYGLYAWTGLADCLYALGEVDQAATEYKAILALEPLSFQALNNYAWLLVTQEDSSKQDAEQAMVLITRAQALNPANHFAWSTLSRVYYEQGDYRQAIKAGRTALQIATLTARQGLTQPQTLITYQLQLERSQLALEATSILE